MAAEFTSAKGVSCEVNGTTVVLTFEGVVDLDVDPMVVDQFQSFVEGPDGTRTEFAYAGRAEGAGIRIAEVLINQARRDRDRKAAAAKAPPSSAP